MSIWQCNSAHHCTCWDDIQGQLYMNTPALSMFHRFISITNIRTVMTFNKTIVINAFQREVTKRYNFSFSCQCFLSAMKKQTSSHRKLTPTCSLPGFFTECPFTNCLIYYMDTGWGTHHPFLSTHIPPNRKGRPPKQV